MSVAQNFARVCERIENAALRAGRDPKEVKLIAVSKTVDVARINELILAGGQRIGENRVQELLVKQDDLLPVEVHLIGQLQSNKVRQIMGRVTLIHSLDRLPLARELQKNAEKAGCAADCLVQVNLADERGKGGVGREELFDFLWQVDALPDVRVRGLMCVPPVSTGAEAAKYFEQLRNLARQASEKMYKSCIFHELSMGMSGDFEEAIAQGATFVRLGSAVFGQR